MSALKHDLSFYKPATDILGPAGRNAADYLSKMTGQPLERCMEFIRRETSAGGAFPLRDPKVYLNVKDPVTGDRHEDMMTLSRYLETVKQENLVLVPTLTAYLPQSEKQSFLGREIIINMKNRGVFKHKKFECTMAKDPVGESIFEALQSSAKYLNNSLSGLMSIPTTALFNKSGHPTLTSTCRNATSYANMHNEQFLAGNRPYFTPKDAIHHILSICNMADMQRISAAIETFNLHLPSPEEALRVICYSLDRYSNSPKARNKILKLLTGLSPVERAAVCYNDDLKHLAEFNPSFVKQFLVDMCAVPGAAPADYPGSFSRLDSDMQTCVMFQNGFLLKGKKKKDVLADPVLVDILDKCAWQLDRTINRIEPIIKAFWLNNILPLNHAYMDIVRRKAIPVSDTDSTIFTTQEWTKFVTGSYNFDEMSFKVGSAVTLLTAKIVSHYLKMMSTNSNVDKSELGRVSMKNEYYYTVIMLTSVAKHYAGLRWGQEGNVLPELTPEIKGVNLRNSAWPEDVKNDVHEFIIKMATGISEGKTFTRDEVFEIPLRTEKNIIDKMSSGSCDLYNIVTVKPENSYAKPMSSPYGHYVLWQEIFSAKYGETPPPPYTGVKVPVKIANPTELRAFLEGIEDKRLAERFKEYIARQGKKDFTNIIIPYSIAVSNGVPKELIPVLDRDTMLSNINGAYYLILNSLGFYIRDKEKSICIYDLYDDSVKLTA